MNFKKSIQKFIPSFKVRDEVAFDYKRLMSGINDLKRQISDLET